MMATNTTGATVVFLDSHPTWLAAQRRSEEIEAAMRRHPSFQSAPETFQSAPETDSHTPAHAAATRRLHAL